jgi:hypothetical protein
VNPVAVCAPVEDCRWLLNFTLKIPVDVNAAEITEGCGIISATRFPVADVVHPILRDRPIMATYAVYAHPDRGFHRLSIMVLAVPVQELIFLSKTAQILLPVKAVPVGSK